MITKWNNEPGTFSIELYLHNNAILDIDDKELSVLKPLSLFIGSDAAELVINFRSSGYDDPGSMYGGTDNLGSPPEGDDERLLESAHIIIDGVEMQLSNKQAETLFAEYEEEINDIELEGTQ